MHNKRQLLVNSFNLALILILIVSLLPLSKVQAAPVSDQSRQNFQTSLTKMQIQPVEPLSSTHETQDSITNDPPSNPSVNPVSNFQQQLNLRDGSWWYISGETLIINQNGPDGEGLSYDEDTTEKTNSGNSNDTSSYSSSRIWPWQQEAGLTINSIQINTPLTVKNQNASLEYLFGGLNSVTTISGLNNLDTTGATSMKAMFYGDYALSSINGIENFVTNSVTDMSYMFSNSALNDTTSPTITFQPQDNVWDTAKVTNMQDMFANNSIKLINLYKLNVTHVKNMSLMFYQYFQQASAPVSLDLSQWQTDSLTDMYSMFAESQISTVKFFDHAHNFLGFNTSHVTSFQSLFQYDAALTEPPNDDYNFALLQTNQVTSTSYMFAGTSFLTINLTGFKVDNVIDISDMFYNCTNLTKVNGLEDWSTGGITNMGAVFENCSSLRDISNLANWDTAKVTNMQSMFSSTGLQYLDVNSWNVSQVQNMDSMFSYCSDLIHLNLTNWQFNDPMTNQTSLNNANSMFSGCSNLHTLDISPMNLTSSNSSGNISYNKMFQGDSNLWKIVLGSQTNFRDSNSVAKLNDGPAGKMLGADSLNTSAEFPTTYTSNGGWQDKAGGSDHEPNGTSFESGVAVLDDDRLAGSKTYVWRQTKGTISLTQYPGDLDFQSHYMNEPLDNLTPKSTDKEKPFAISVNDTRDPRVRGGFTINYSLSPFVLDTNQTISFTPQLLFNDRLSNNNSGIMYENSVKEPPTSDASTYSHSWTSIPFKLDASNVPHSGSYTATMVYTLTNSVTNPTTNI
ncbi:DUF285 domain-containing protein [Bombilactobacillus folatiphilus]|uniref:DUF285 domain-containing protein n=1 Tax=Bombilactobacillus folatiphilus TaxID=2923362 RepID=A0ABY4P8Z9_9LACO|nr:BspA family leucine-rich repeat surface protein [Bombilactobacillus folatiphilus]UQS82218.1 DUF285 domain-containing protein [Bombilactobacillus folatiphilus]